MRGFVVAQVVLIVLAGCMQAFEREGEVPLPTGGGSGGVGGIGAIGGVGGDGGTGGMSGAGGMAGDGGMSGTGGMAGDVGGIGGNSGSGGMGGTGGMSGSGGSGGIGSVLVLCPGALFIPCLPVAPPAARCCTAGTMCGTKADSTAPCL